MEDNYLTMSAKRSGPPSGVRGAAGGTFLPQRSSAPKDSYPTLLKRSNLPSGFRYQPNELGFTNVITWWGALNQLSGNCYMEEAQREE